MAVAIGVYIHIPFCHHRCTYCDFNIYAGMRAWHERYARAVAKEIDGVGSSPGLRSSSGDDSYAAATIYFGGGTPSLLPVEHVALILGAIRSAFDVAADAEISFEANPRPDADGYFERLRALGVNRASLGMQSAIERDLHLFRRGHTFADVTRTFALLRAAGFDNLNLDLIYGIPGQSLDEWRVTLDAALSLGPEHVSAYSLQVEDGTTLKKWIAQGKVSSPDDDLAADMFTLAEDVLDAAGFSHYEISNWAKSVLDLRWPSADFQNPQSTINHQQFSRHNLIYWRNQPYLGFGCGAHSWFGGRRFSNVRHVRDYVERLEAGQGVEAESEAIPRELEMGETMMLGLRLLDEGVSFERFRSRFDADVREVYAVPIERLSSIGLLDVTAERVRLSRSGRLVGNRVFGEFLPD
jgi:oxygen-independent coproporphyrinogen-3 oxidase